MARRPRIAFEGAIYHIAFRGNGRQNIFLDDGDRGRFLESLAERVERYGVRLFLYCLMDNHGHLLVETPKANISAFMGSLLTSYTTYFNRKHQRVGHVTEGRYKSPLVEGDEYLLRLSRYIHQNPVHVAGWEKNRGQPLNIRLFADCSGSFRTPWGQRGQEGGDDLELEILLVPVTVVTALEDADLGVGSFDYAQAALVLQVAVGGDAVPMALDHPGELLEGRKPLPLERILDLRRRFTQNASCQWRATWNLRGFLDACL
jgi:REP element-mobilizing transposase RayT